MKSYTLEPIGFVHSPYKEKFGTPREPTLVPSAKGEIHLNPQVAPYDSLSDLLPESKIWVIFLFHEIPKQEKLNAKIRPPRLGGKSKISLYATRSPHRPNRLGLSLVHFHKLDMKNGKPVLHISGHDLIDQTPVFDVKPYLYEFEAHEAPAHYETDWKNDESHLHKKEVTFSELAKSQLKKREDLFQLISEYLSHDPRPAYHREKEDMERTYSNKLDDFDIKWKVEGEIISVLEATRIIKNRKPHKESV